MDARKKRREVREFLRKAEERAHGGAQPAKPAPSAVHEMACICGQLLRIKQELDEQRCACPGCKRKFEVNFVTDPKTGKAVLQPMYLDEAEPPSGDTQIMELPGNVPLSAAGGGLLDAAFGPPPPPQLIFPCPQCKRRMVAKKETYDKRVRCPDCQTRMVLTVIYDPERRAHGVEPVRVTDAPSGDTWLLDR
jgi:DNA-directed RNA polymerase subunit RPC12/RpoP